MTYPWIEKMLDRLGLWNSLRGIPGLVAIAVPSIALTYFALSELAVPALIRSLLSAILGVPLSLIGYYAGNFWDSSMFDPRYGPSGRWIGRENRPYHLFPAGAGLQRCRQQAAEALFPLDHSSKGVYREAELRAKRTSSLWPKIEQPLILSKFIRSLLWPCVLLAALLIIFGLWILVSDVRNPHLGVLAAGLITALFAVLLFVPYFNLRVEHMMRLYQWASKLRSDKPVKMSSQN